ncbi:MAG TPA: cobalamin biosynthesis protein CbiD [Spirochaeta sp.]|nr:cobalamin biosynthesis protein CbiD [Spirochaeta sp.]
MADDYREVLGRADGLRRGFTTGTTASAAAKAAAAALLSGGTSESVTITLPAGSKSFSGKEIDIPVNSCVISVKSASASVLKDAGDDKDDTNGLEIFAEAKFRSLPGIEITAGEGIGRVTGFGLPVKPGNPAINPVPQKMIRNGVEQLLDHALLPDGFSGIGINITAPEGRTVAAKTWNSRIGVEGGISIIGTSGVVEPRSEKAFLTTLGLVIKVAAAEHENFTIISGYVGERFMSELDAVENSRIAVGDFIGFGLEQCARRGMKKLFLPLHIGKLTKIAAGLFNTHCDFGDARLETLAAAAGACGADTVQIQQLLALSLAEESVSLLNNWQLTETFNLVAERAKWRCIKYLEKSAAGRRETSAGAVPVIETAALDLQGQLLGWSGDYETSEELCKNFL